MLKKSCISIICMVLVLSAHHLYAQAVQTSVQEKDGEKVFTLSNEKIVQQVFIKNDMLSGDLLAGKQAWLKKYHNNRHGVRTDGDFALKMMWTGWSAPGREVNANVQVSFSKKDYTYQSYQVKNISGGGKTLALYFTPDNHANTIQLRLTYQLFPGKFYARRQIAVRDTVKESNWLDTFISRKGSVSAEGKKGAHSIIKKGAFGQPCAVDFARGGAFFGVEYPAATTTVKIKNNKHLHLLCKEIIGTVVKDQWVKSKWVVEGLAPDHDVKQWFLKYLPDIRIAKNEPYALYNSWYDLRSPAFKNVAPEHIMNEKNILKIIDRFKKNMIEPYGIHLDAFVLDDGWDVHKSDWQLRKTTFPHGLKPISDELKKLGTALGIWYGPTGGYSFRMDRINWMRDHGYEVVGRGHSSMLCLGGKKYSALFQKRTTDMVKNGGVGYFKWDGLQFSCSDPTHGHPVGKYSRRAILDSLIAKCKAVRAINPDVYLNITSGTWLSPWWMKYANQIWMQGGDYGFADVPSVSQRDASMTYKDLVLYNDFHNLDEWFPISNLMTHGIIKGTLNEIGGKDDPLSKFTNDAMFYFGRGVTMYELYISPDLLNKGEWNALSKSLKWAEDRFPVLNNNTWMIGGDPTQAETYGYAHYKKNKGIIAVRNPQMKAQDIQVKLDPAQGIDPEAGSLVLERVYPDHWISPDLYSAGATITLPLKGYESAIYEVYPLDSANHPLLADVSFSINERQDHAYDLDVLQTGDHVKILNPARVKSITINGQQAASVSFSLPSPTQTILEKPVLHFNGNGLTTEMTFGSDDLLPRFVVFLHPDSSLRGQAIPEARLTVDGKEVKTTRQQQKGVWSVYSYVLPAGTINGKHTFHFDLVKNDKTKSWKGHADVWLIEQRKVQPVSVSITSKETVKENPMPPSPYEKDAVGRQVKLGEGEFSL